MTEASPTPVIALTGPTASGKTGLAIDLAEAFDLAIVSVDSAMVYRGMDIGTAKPDAETLARAPHRLIDIRDPEQTYSAGDFAADARREIEAIRATGRTALLTGGTLLYFRALLDGIAALPPRQPAIRSALDEEGERLGWAALHARLGQADPESAARIEPSDRQRIQRALEVLTVTGRPLSELQREGRASAPRYSVLRLALAPDDRSVLKQTIAERFDAMLEQGFVDEVARLRERPGLDSHTPSMRAVGYRQLWRYLAGDCDLDTARHDAVVATRRLAKRQLTWLRGDRRWLKFSGTPEAIRTAVRRHIE